MAIDPSLIGAIGSTGVGALVGAFQALTSGQKKKEKALEAQAANAPKYGGNQGISDYFQQARQQANTAAQQSDLFKQSQLMQQRNMASGLAGSNVAKGGQGLVSRLVQGANDAAGQSLVQAQAQKERRFGQFGQAVQMKSADDWKKWQINVQQPWETKYNLLAAKAAAAAQQKQAGLQNITGGLMNMGTALAGSYSKNYNSGNNDSTTAGKDPNSR